MQDFTINFSDLQVIIDEAETDIKSILAEVKKELALEQDFGGSAAEAEEPSPAAANNR